MCASREGYVDLKVCFWQGNYVYIYIYIWLLRARDKRSWKSKRNRSLSSSDNTNDRYTCEVIRLAFKRDRESWEGIDKSAPGVKSLRNGSTPDRNTPVTYTYAFQLATTLRTRNSSIRRNNSSPNRLYKGKEKEKKRTFFKKEFWIFGNITGMEIFRHGGYDR